MAMIEIKMSASEWRKQSTGGLHHQREQRQVVVVCGPSRWIRQVHPHQDGATASMPSKGEIFLDGTAVHDPKANLAKLRSCVGMVCSRISNSSAYERDQNLTIGHKPRSWAAAKMRARDKGLKCP